MPESKYRNKLAAQAAQGTETPPRAGKPAERVKTAPPQPYTQQREAESIASLQRAWQESIEYWDTHPVLLPSPATYFFSMPTKFVYTDEQAFFGDIKPMLPEFSKTLCR